MVQYGVIGSFENGVLKPTGKVRLLLTYAL